jgi:hypothetical protein
MMAAIVVPLGCLRRARTASCLVPLRVETEGMFPRLRRPFRAALGARQLGACGGFAERHLRILFGCDGIRRRHHRSPTVAPSPAGQDPGWGRASAWSLGCGLCFAFGPSTVRVFRAGSFSRARSSRSAMRRSASFASSSAIFARMRSSEVSMMPLLIMIGKLGGFCSNPAVTGDARISQKSLRFRILSFNCPVRPPTH